MSKKVEISTDTAKIAVAVKLKLILKEFSTKTEEASELSAMVQEFRSTANKLEELESEMKAIEEADKA